MKKILFLQKLKASVVSLQKTKKDRQRQNSSASSLTELTRIIHHPWEVLFLPQKKTKKLKNKDLRLCVFFLPKTETKHFCKTLNGYI